MKRGRETLWRPTKLQEVASLEDVLAQLQRSRSIYFVKSLSKTILQTRKAKKTATLSLPTQFAQENGDKIEEWVILRAHPSCASCSRPWTVRLSVTGRSPETRKIQFCDGLYAFVAGNRLREGDSLIFVLQEDARSEFEVYMFRRSGGVPLYPDEGDSASSDEENDSNYSSIPSPLHHQDKKKKAFTNDIREGRATPSQFTSHFENHRMHKKAFTSDIKEGRATPSQLANRFENHRVHKRTFTSDNREGRITPLQNAHHRQNHRVFPSFVKQLTASNIGRSDRDPRSHSAQFGFPTPFIRDHGEQVRTSVKLQGIHEDSPTHVVTCRRRPGHSCRADFVVTGWSKFVKANGLEKGHKLQFTLMADSYFVVRKVY